MMLFFGGYARKALREYLPLGSFMEFLQEIKTYIAKKHKM